MKRGFERLRRWLRRDRGWQEEIESHLAFREDWNRAQGMASVEARLRALRQFGNTLRIAEDVRAVYVRPWLDHLVQDARQAMRSYRKAPAFSIVAVATIALGVGASTAVFSAVDPILFRHLPYPNDDQLVSVGFYGPVDNNEFNVDSAYLDWRKEQTAFQSLTSMRPGEACDLVTENTPQRLNCFAVESNFLRTFGVAPVAGRDFTPEENRPNAPPVILLSYQLWQQRFGADPRVLGATVTLDENPVRVIGVLPKGFEMPQLAEADILRPETFDPSLPRTVNSNRFLRTFARLKEGVAIEQARARMLPLFQHSVRQDVPLELGPEVRLVVQSLRDRQIHEVKLQSWMLLGAVLGLMLLACANVANLLLARAAARHREMALRAAIGAGRGRLIGQMLTESILLGLAGGAAGCALGWALLRLFVRLAPEGLLRLDQARIDLRVLAFAFTVSLFSAVLFGIAPALERPRAEALASWRAVGTVRTLFRKSLVAAQVALSLVLLTGASLFAHSLWKLENQPLGFQPEHLVTASFALRRHRYQSPPAQTSFFQEVESRLRRIPGGGSFALSDSIPPRGSLGRPYSNIRIAGHPPLAPNGGLVAFRWVTPGYFQTLGIRVLAGRDFNEAERDLNEPLAILNATLARRIFGAENPIGQRMELDGDGTLSRIVGVAADSKNAGVVETAEPEYYRLRQNNGRGLRLGAVAVFRTSLDTATLTRWIQREFAALDPDMPVTIESMETRVGRFTQRPRFIAMVVGMFALCGLMLAAVGLYGVLAFLVAQQTREIGVRMALGARPRDVALRVERYAGMWTAIGAAAGLICSLALTRAVQGLLFEVTPDDPLSFGVALALLAAVAALAAWAPSHRAARVDPAVALREE